jgi:hypothetical protein
MSYRVTPLSTSTPEELQDQSHRSLFDRIFLGALVWVIPLILTSIFLSGSVPGRQISSAEDSFVYAIQRQLYHKK